MSIALSERLRLAALDRCGILDTPPDSHFDRITRLAAQFFDAPMAAISFVTHDRCWFKSTYGLGVPQLARSASFCSHTIGSPEALVIPDATADASFAGLALVADHPHVRFYAGVPVFTTEGFAVGALAVMDTRPRGPLSESAMCTLHDFSALISRELSASPSAGAPQDTGDSSILSAVVQSAEDAIITIDLNRVILTWNPGAERLYGYSAAEVRGHPIDVIIPPDLLEEAHLVCGKAQQGQPTLRREIVRLHKDGSRRFVSRSVFAITDAEGRPIGIGGIAHDITPLKLAEAARLEAEEHLNLAQEAAGLGIWDWSVPNSTITRSEQCCRIFGLPVTQTTTPYVHWLSIVHPEDRDRVQAYHANLLRGTRHGEAEFRIIWPDGSVHWVVSKARTYLNAAGEAAQVIGVNLDVTHLREAEHARRESEQRYSDLFRTMNQSVSYLDAKGSVLAANPAADRLFGLSIEETRGRHNADLQLRVMSEDGTPVSPSEFPAIVALRSGSEVHGVVQRVWNPQTGEPHWISTDAIPRFRAGEPKPYEVQVICHDLTPQVEAAARLRVAEERSRLLIEHGMEVIAVIDTAATILYVSPSVERVFGYPPDLLIGTNAAEHLHPDDQQAVQESLQSILHSPPSVAAALQIRLRNRDGEWRTVESAAANCLQVEGLRGIVANLRDITERQHYEEQLRISHDQAAPAFRAHRICPRGGARPHLTRSPR